MSALTSPVVVASIGFNMAQTLEDLKLVNSGKVREIYEIEDDLLLVASDRISIYDVIMPTRIPDKGKVLTDQRLVPSVQDQVVGHQTLPAAQSQMPFHKGA